MKISEETMKQIKAYEEREALKSITLCGLVLERKGGGFEGRIGAQTITVQFDSASRVYVRINNDDSDRFYYETLDEAESQFRADFRAWLAYWTALVSDPGIQEFASFLTCAQGA